MFNKRWSWKPALCLTCAVALAGCGGGPAATEVSTGSTTTSTDDHGHGHDAHGPHGGDLVELGDDEYHAEVVHDTEGPLNVYILDGAATTAVAIDAAEIALNVTHDGAAEQFTLTASPTESDPAGQSSRFVCDDSHAAEDLDHEGTQAKLVVTINGVSYQGSIVHDHGHADGDHVDGDHQH